MGKRMDGIAGRGHDERRHRSARTSSGETAGPSREIAVRSAAVTCCGVPLEEAEQGGEIVRRLRGEPPGGLGPFEGAPRFLGAAVAARRRPTSRFGAMFLRAPGRHPGRPASTRRATRARAASRPGAARSPRPSRCRRGPAAQVPLPRSSRRRRRRMSRSRRTRDRPPPSAMAAAFERDAPEAAHRRERLRRSGSASPHRPCWKTTGRPRRRYRRHGGAHRRARHAGPSRLNPQPAPSRTRAQESRHAWRLAPRRGHAR